MIYGDICLLICDKTDQCGMDRLSKNVISITLDQIIIKIHQEGCGQECLENCGQISLSKPDWPGLVGFSCYNLGKIPIKVSSKNVGLLCY